MPPLSSFIFFVLGDVDLFLVAPPPNEEQVVLSKIYDITMGATHARGQSADGTLLPCCRLVVAGLGVLRCLQGPARRQRAPAGDEKPRGGNFLQASRRAAAGRLEHIQEPLRIAVVVRHRFRMLRLRAKLRHCLLYTSDAADE